VLWRWLSDLAPYAPERAATLSAAVERAVDALAGLPTAPATPVHRDLHDGHLLIAPDGAVGLLECDALAAGDPALDLGNLLAHLTWRVRQHRLDRAGAGDTAAAILDGYAAGPDERERAAAYAAAAELRLACVYAFRPRWSAIASGVAAPALLPAITAP
jgi:aminoglycoside phosphotransferase (APT) family kinase protein